MAPGATLPDSALLEVRGVDRSFGGVKALQKMDLTLVEGESAALIGPNGSGKSTLVNVITRMVDADNGTIRMSGEDVTRVSPYLIADHGIARSFQHVRLIPDLTLMENVVAGGVYRDLRRFAGEFRSWLGGRVRRSDRAAADAALDMMGVPVVLRDRTPRQVPFAMQRQTEVARALVSRPRALLLDEPVAGMNPAEVRMFLSLLRNINSSGIATLLIEHNMDFVMQAASTVTVINRGQRIASGPADEVRRDHAVIEAYLGTGHAAGKGDRP